MQLVQIRAVDRSVRVTVSDETGQLFNDYRRVAPDTWQHRHRFVPAGDAYEPKWTEHHDVYTDQQLRSIVGQAAMQAATVTA